MRALDIITDAYERLNRLSPGETLSADDAAFGFRRLNLLVDEMSSSIPFLYQDRLTSAAQSGNITLGTGAWAALGVGDEIVSATANNFPMLPITMRQYNEIYQPAATGIPSVWAFDGLVTVYMWPVPTGQTIKLQTRIGVVAFADQTTVYTAPGGYASALGAALAVRIAPSLMGKVPEYLLRAERAGMAGIEKHDPAILDVSSFSWTHGGGYYSPRRLF